MKHLCPGLNSATNFTIFRISSKFYDFSLCSEIDKFTFCAIFRFRQARIPNFTVFAVFRFRQRRFTKFAKFRRLNDVLRRLVIFLSTDASWLTDFTKFAKFRSLNDFPRCVAIFFKSFVLLIASHKA